MKPGIDCLPCLVRQASEAVAFCEADDSRRTEIMRHILTELARIDWTGVPPATAQILHRLIRKETGHPDPYRAMKEDMNRLALQLLPFLQSEARLQEDPRAAVLRLAVAGNLIDAGAKTGLTETEIRATLCRTCQGECLKGSARALFQAADLARKILYLTDNAGEIVFDRALIEMLPKAKMTVGVRGSAVLNDATLDDAETAGLPGLVRVISNGSDAPGILLEDCSAEFRRVFDESDLIIAKGQGNFESLSDTAKPIFFLLQVKCACVAEHLGIPVGRMAVCECNKTAGKMKTCILP